MYFRSVFVWFVVGGFFGDGLYFAISKIYESRFNGSHRQRSYQLTFASNPPCSAFPNSTFMPCNLAIRWTIDSPSPLPVAVCPGAIEAFANSRQSLWRHTGAVIPHDEIISIQRDVYHAALWTVAHGVIQQISHQQT